MRKHTTISFMLIVVCLLGIPFQTAHALTFKTEWNTLLKTYPQFEKAKQSVCIADEKGDTLFSFNENKVIIPASVSKIYLQDYVLSKLGATYTYKTKVVRYKNTLYINGSLDPFFTGGDLKKIILATEKKIGDRKIEKIVFTNMYFDWSTNPAQTKINLESFIKINNLVKKDAEVVHKTSPYSGRGKIYTFTGAPLSQLFKQMNIFSTNSSSHALFMQLGGPEAFQVYMKETYGAGKDTISFETGSGLYRNTTTCALTLRVLRHLHEYLMNNNIRPEDFLVFPGLDGGSMRNRMSKIKEEKKLLVKPGYIYNHETLAGILKTKTGYVYFGVFTEYPNKNDAKSGRDFVDLFSEKLIISFKAIPFEYTPASYNQDHWTKIK